MNTRSLLNKKIVIIGGTSGLGLSAAEYFINNGANLVVVGKEVDTLEASIKKLGSGAEIMIADATDEETAVAAIEHCKKAFGGFDGLYHVAGGSGRKYGDGPLHELTLDGWNKTLELNLTSLMLSNRAAVRSFLDQGAGGTILNIGSVLAQSPSPKFFSTHAYAAAKSAIEGFSKSLAAYYAKDNIRINVIVPGLIDTPMSQRAVQDDQIKSFIQNKQPLDGARVGSVADLDGLALYFMSDLSKFTTGQVISVDGGWSVSGG